MDFLWILVAFAFGFLVKQVNLPPLVGYLIAGFSLHALGVEPFPALITLSDLGITLMLFTIGLKINFRDLGKHEVWAGASVHMGIWCLLFAGLQVLTTVFLSSLGLEFATAVLTGFALSFSSTVCVMKTLEENAELKTRHGDLSIGILVIQDILAVVFLATAAGNTPEIWALLLLALPVLKPTLRLLLDRCGHGELLVLVGVFLALGGPELFELAGLKGDLGALVLGMLLAGSPKSNELYKSLMSMKDLFLIGFFLSIGFAALPTWEGLVLASLALLLLPLKFALFFALFSAFGLRGRTSFLSALALMNFSEFGLIVASYSVDIGWLNEDGLVVLALAVALSFGASTFLYNHAHEIYARWKSLICRFERASARTKYVYEQPRGAEVLLVGMGRVGGGAYRALSAELGEKLWGVEADEERAKKQRAEGYQVVLGDADDIDFWEQLDLASIRLIMLAIPSVQEMKNILYQLRQAEFGGKIAAVARYEDERQELLELGADVVFNYYSEVGTGFADECAHLLRPGGITP